MKKPKLPPILKLIGKIARTLLNIGSIHYKETGDPYEWASGMKMRNYNDNRLLLGNYNHRWRVARFFKLSLGEYAPDYVLGIPTAGIAPAASLAQLIKKPLLINNGKEILYYKPNIWENFVKDKTSFGKKKLDAYIKANKISIILTYGDEMIPYGVQLANITQQPFGYIRKEPKKHGKGKQIEGLMPKDAIPLIIFDGSKYTEEKVLASFPGEEKILLDINKVIDLNKHKIIEFRVVESILAKVVAIEDLISTGGSSAKEIEKIRNLGFTCDLCLSIYNYGFESSKKQFNGEKAIDGTMIKLDPPCEIKSLLTFEDMMEEMERIGYSTQKKRTAMKEEYLNFDKNYNKLLSQKA